jgi:hypothetical protein
MSGDQVAAKKANAPGVSRRQVLTYSATAAGALTVGGVVGAAAQREIENAQIPPRLSHRKPCSTTRAGSTRHPYVVSSSPDHPRRRQARW